MADELLFKKLPDTSVAICRGAPVRWLEKIDGTRVLQYRREYVHMSAPVRFEEWVDVPIVREDGRESKSD